MGSIDISHEESNLIFKKLLNEQFKPEQTENLTLAMNFKISQNFSIFTKNADGIIIAQ